jgi:signal transduction histidine kinase
MKAAIGTIRSDFSGFGALAAVAMQAKGLVLDALELDFSGCSFFEANMAAPLYAILAHNYDRLNRVDLTNLRPAIQTILRKNQFLTRFGFSEEYDANETTLPFKIFKLSAGEQFADYLDRYMQGRGIPQMSIGLTKKFRQSLFEIFQNAALHSRSQQGLFACGQFFPSKNRIDFTIADAGIGIRENVRRYLKNKKISSCKAIEWALEEGHTTKTGRQPGGLGLKLIKDFIRLNKGKIQIVSRFGFCEFTFKGEKINKMDHDFPGTCVNIEINTHDPHGYCLVSELKAADIF